MSNKSEKPERDPRESGDDGGSVYVGLSGGVDSSVSCALLKEQGYDVTGVFIKIWHPELSNCDWKAEMRDAMRVCAHLDIEFKMIDLSDEYYKDVIGYLIEEYKIGRTPNPDVMCNKIIKFGHFYDWAMSEGADFVATGHYAQILRDPEINSGSQSPSRLPELGSGSPSDTNNETPAKARTTVCGAGTTVFLERGVDHNKDQTYFLWNIKKEALSNTIFPIGKFEKSEVRKLAEKYNLPNSDKKDSQGLCFIGDVDLKAFLKKHLNTKRGNVLNEEGRVVGEHDGAELYTFGERHGFKINNKIDNQKANYIIKKDLEKNTITISDSENFEKEEIKIKELELSKINLLVDEFESKDLEVLVRYRGKLLKAEVNIKDKKIIFEEKQSVVANGQSVVFYDQEKCLGGGVVDSFIK
ncbi:tRNA-specific 2-thiouridylase [Candidatus Pacebacteria bacterium]|nr:tRNA-specific 2-thiouridylase [Candidatus Paceibacterota bacterium]